MFRRLALLSAVLVMASLWNGADAFAQQSIQPLFYSPQTLLVPPHVGGDADFKGHGPRVELYVRLYIKTQAPNEVWAEVRIDALETKSDWTRASSWSKPQHIRVATFARPITVILTPTDFGPNPTGVARRTFVYVDTNDKIAEKIFNPCQCGLLNSVTIQGDTVGREAGTRTGVLLEFNPILAW